MAALPDKGKKILLVDDNESFLALFLTLPEADDYHIETQISGEAALEFLKTHRVDLIISDVQMPDMDGFELFKNAQDIFPDIPMILITSFGSTHDAIEAVKCGAFHYFEKPLENHLELFWTTVREALAKGEMLRKMACFMREKSLLSTTKTPIIGTSPAIRRVLQQIREVAELPVTVLIQGETGTGKELVAREIYEQGNRKDFPYFAVSCTELEAGVLSSELFGHEKGAFTGAIEQKKGLFEMAHHGTIFLDEISDASVSLQAKLLRVLETQTVRRIGGTENLPLEFRVLAATNRVLSDEVTQGRFRQDLLYRLNGYVIDVPPLRERREDIPVLAEFYLNRFCKAYKKLLNGFTENAMMTLREYEWPGNVRELVNVVERAVITCCDAVVTSNALPFKATEGPLMPGLSLIEMEKYCIHRALHCAKNNKSQAADLLGIARKTLIAKIKKHRLLD